MADEHSGDQPQHTAGIRLAGLRKTFDRPVLEGVNLEVGSGQIVALLGPSGCGKTTMLRLIAGLEEPDAGEIHLGQAMVTGPRRHVSPEKRRVGLVFQDWALFGHMTVGENVAYGLPRKERSAQRVEDALAMVGLEGLADRQPGTLSGGQQQRVALARALAPQPSVLLMDEPFSNLDTSLRVHIRTEIHQLLVRLGITTVFVTHDQEEAFVLGDRVAVMSHGQIVQQGTPVELYESPATPWVADFVGDANLLDATAKGPVVETPLGSLPLRRPQRGQVQAVIRPEDIALEPGGDGQIELTEYYGHDTVYLVRTGAGTQLRVRAAAAPKFSRGDAVSAAFAGTPVVAFGGLAASYQQGTEPDTAPEEPATAEPIRLG